MRYYPILLYLFIFSSCGAQKETSNQDKQVIPPPNISCPDDGDCSFEILENSFLSLQYSELGELYPEVIEGDKTVVKFHYQKDVDKVGMDSGYSEFVYLEFDPNERQIILKNKELQKVKMVFGRICYCKGAMGYFPVQEGSLFLFNTGKNLQLRTTFKVNKIPQIIKQIDENINY